MNFRSVVLEGPHNVVHSFLRARDPRERKVNISRSCHTTSDVTLGHSLVNFQGLVYPELEETTLLHETHSVRVTEATSLRGW